MAKKRKNTKKVQTTKRRKYRRRNKIKINKKIWVLLLIPILLLILLVFLVFKDNEEIGKENQKPNYLTETGEKKTTISLTNEDGTVIEVLEVGKDGKIKEPTIPTKEGYEFVEWQYNGTKFDFSQPITENITLIAVWKELPKAVKQYKVTFNSDGGTKVAQQFIEEGKVASMPTNPKKNGYTFVEWQLNGKKYNFNTQVTKDITLKAKWKKVEQQVQPTTPVPAPAEPAPVPLKEYTITFNSDGGTTIESQTVKEGNKVTRPTDPIKTDYAFIEWQLNGTTYNFETAVTSNITLTAKWTKKYVPGEKVNIGNQYYNVVRDNGTTLTLLAKYNVTKSGVQTSNRSWAYGVVSESDWTGKNDIDLNTHTGGGSNRVKAHVEHVKTLTGRNDITGTMLTVSDINEIRGLGMIVNNNQPYWLRTTCDNSVWNFYYINEQGYRYCNPDVAAYGIRPLITVPKDIFEE